MVDFDYPYFWGDRSAFESLALFDFFQWSFGVILLTWNLSLGPVIFPYLTGRVPIFPESISMVFYPYYLFFLGWENVSKLFESLMMDFNAQTTASLMHTIIFPYVLYQWFVGNLDNIIIHTKCHCSLFMIM